MLSSIEEVYYDITIFQLDPGHRKSSGDKFDMQKNLQNCFVRICTHTGCSNHSPSECVFESVVKKQVTFIWITEKTVRKRKEKD